MLLPGYGFGDTRRGGLISRFQGCQALLERRLLLDGFSGFHGCFALRDLRFRSLALGFRGLRGIRQAGQLLLALLGAHVFNIHVFRFLTVCGF